MQKRWIWAAAAVLTAAVAVTGTVYGERGFRYADRRFGWTEAGRSAAFDALWLRAESEYTARSPKDRYGFYMADYPAKAELLAQPDRVLARLEAVPHDFFEMDLMMALGRAQAGALVQADLERGRCYVTREYLQAFYTADELKRLAVSELPATCRSSAWYALDHTSIDPSFMQALVDRYKNSEIPYYLADTPEFQQAAMAAYDGLGTRARVALALRARGENLKERLAQETDPSARFALLNQLGDREGMMAAVEAGGYPWGSWMNWQWEREMAERYPNSFLARGIRAYEAVRGKNYFQWDRRKPGSPYEWWEYGNRQYDPAREIPGWEAYLAAFSRHGGADDAAYRLGRSYEIKGDYANALRWLYAAVTLPDGEMATHAQSRIAWILDAHLTDDELKALTPPAELKLAAEYSLAVRKLRAGGYADALADLDRLLAAGGPAPLPEGGMPFWQGVRNQRKAVARLVALSADSSPEGRYALAAAIFHDELIFYNYLWGGGRAGYFYSGGGHAAQALSGDMDERYTTWFSQFNNYIQAAQRFAELESTPGAVGDKAAYSRARSLLHLERGYGWDVALWRPRPEIADEAKALLERFVQERPKSDLADDALLSLGYLTMEKAYFDRVVREYPKSDSAPTAKSATFPDPRPAFATALPFRYLTLGAAPPEVAAWARPYLGKQGYATMQAGGATYLLFTNADPGLLGTVSVRDDYTASARWEADSRGTGYALVRVFTTKPIR